jgi:hypothetical protein
VKLDVLAAFRRRDWIDARDDVRRALRVSLTFSASWQ